MKFRTLRNWEKPEELEGMVFFAQLLEELLFDYSLDTYKPSAMNTSTLCGEARGLIGDIEQEVIDSANLNYVLEELVVNLKKDEVASGLVDIDVITIENKLVKENTTLTEKKTIVEILHSQILLSKYKEKTESLLMEAISAAGEKNRIRALARSYITTLISLGYSTRYLYPAVRRFFYWGENRITKVEDLKIFFDLVSGKRYQYRAVLRASTLFDEIKDSCAPFKIDITKILDEETAGYARDKNFSVGDDESFLVVNDIESLDVFSARDHAESRVERLSTLVNFFHHKEVPTWEKSALLINLDTGRPRKISSAENPMLMCSDMKTAEAAVKLNSFINEFDLQFVSFQRFIRAAELHSLALRSDSPENQLLNLWVALETIVPSKLGRSKAKINNVIDSIIPFLSLNYIYSLTDRLVRDYRIWNRSALNRALHGIDGDNDRQKFIRLLLLEDCADARSSLYSDLGNFYLLRNRTHYFATSLSSPKKISRILKAHADRVDWQIRRIYRTRNQIVHAGHTPRYINVLIKNIHDYLDIVLGTIGDLASDGERFRTNDQIFKYVEIKYLEYEKELKDAAGNINQENIEALVINKRI
ncbi:HEPN domain-containing protein [Porticoccaceae bacterium LTM1]|nr:HEPN domain-containing protein [Porticoccaceae bacterium LTM1]